MTKNPNIIDPAEDVSAKVRTRRHTLGVTQARLARLADCSVSSLALIEQGAVPRRSLVLERLNAALDAIEQVSAG
jgi:predicted transcriptional regulator